MSYKDYRRYLNTIINSENQYSFVRDLSRAISVPEKDLEAMISDLLEFAKVKGAKYSVPAFHRGLLFYRSFRFVMTEYIMFNMGFCIDMQADWENDPKEPMLSWDEFFRWCENKYYKTYVISPEEEMTIRFEGIL